MTSFGWKRMAKLQTSVDTSFDVQEDDDKESLADSVEADTDYLHPAKRARLTSCLEDRDTKSKRLQDEGSLLAENERYWEAIKYWDEAIQLTPGVATLHEMKSQALLELGELIPAVQCAEKAIALDPCWASARQSMGRAQLGFGELNMALRSFQKALHLLPTDSEIRNDLKWTRELLKQKAALDEQVEHESENIINEV